MRILRSAKRSGVKKDYSADHYITTGQMAKVFGVSRFTVIRRFSEYRHIDNFRTPHGIMWNKYQAYQHYMPRANDGEIYEAMLKDRDRIQIKRKGRQKDVKHI